MSKQVKTYWLINQYSSTPETGMGGRNYYFAKELAKKGHKIYLIAASYTHMLHQPPNVEGSFKIESVDGFQFIWIKTPKYSSAYDKKRVLNWFIFSWKLLNLPKIIRDKPDAILVSSPSLFSFLGAQRLAKIFKAKLVFEVRDIWPLTLIDLGGYSPRHPLIKLMQWVEDRAYHDANVVISNLPYASEHMVTRGMDRDKFHWIPNGFDSQEMESREDLPLFVMNQIPKNKFIIGYTGTLGVANALSYFVAAAKIAQDNEDVAFVIVGKGKEKKALVKQAKELSNVVFIDAIPKLQIPAMLDCFDICYAGFKKRKLYQYGSSLNKLSEYLMSGKPIIYSIDSPFKPIDEAKCGFTVPSEDPQSAVNAIFKLKAFSSVERDKLGKNGREYGLKNLDYAKLVKKLANVLLDEK